MNSAVNEREVIPQVAAAGGINFALSALCTFALDCTQGRALGYHILAFQAQRFHATAVLCSIRAALMAIRVSRDRRSRLYRLSTVPSATLIEKCCLLACPVAGNPTQYVIEQAFALSGLDWRFMTFEVEPLRLGDAMRGIRALGFHGVKIGEPFHESALEHLDGLSDRAQKCGSVNVIAVDGDKLVGDNTEGAALVEVIRQNANIVGKKAMVVGAGRMARATAVALGDAGITGITVASRSAEKGERLVDLIQQRTATTAALVHLSGAIVAVDPEIALLVNATSLSTNDSGARLPLDPASFGQKMTVADVAYNTSRTWLTRQAAERGCCTIDGLSIFVQQTALALKVWTGQMPDTISMREAAEEFLGI